MASPDSCVDRPSSSSCHHETAGPAPRCRRAVVPVSFLLIRIAPRGAAALAADAFLNQQRRRCCGVSREACMDLHAGSGELPANVAGTPPALTLL